MPTGTTDSAVPADDHQACSLHLISVVSFLQASTAHFAILIEDDFNYWMPTGTNCEQLKFVLDAAVDVILDMTLLFFKYAAGEC